MQKSSAPSPSPGPGPGPGPEGLSATTPIFAVKIVASGGRVVPHAAISIPTIPMITLGYDKTRSDVAEFTFAAVVKNSGAAAVASSDIGLQIVLAASQSGSDNTQLVVSPVGQFTKGLANDVVTPSEGVLDAPNGHAINAIAAGESGYVFSQFSVKAKALWDVEIALTGVTWWSANFTALAGASDKIPWTVGDKSGDSIQIPQWFLVTEAAKKSVVLGATAPTYKVVVK